MMNPKLIFSLRCLARALVAALLAVGFSALAHFISTIAGNTMALWLLSGVFSISAILVALVAIDQALQGFGR
jgi:hypothetical protein